MLAETAAPGRRTSVEKKGKARKPAADGLKQPPRGGSSIQCNPERGGASYPDLGKIPRCARTDAVERSALPEAMSARAIKV